MEKSKNRTDLLAAGRKKLQQFRQKKDHKATNSSISSHGKSSQKAGNQFEGGDAEIVPHGLSVDAELTNASQTGNAVEADSVLPVAKLLATLAEGGSVVAVGEEPTPDESPASSFAGEANGKIEEPKDSGDPPDLPSMDRSSGPCQTSDQDADCPGMEQSNRSTGVEKSEVGTSESGRGEANISVALQMKEDVQEPARPRLEVFEEEYALPVLAEGAHDADGDISSSERVSAGRINEDAVATPWLGIGVEQEGIQDLRMENQRDEQLFASRNDIVDAEKTDEDTNPCVKLGFDEAQVADTVQLPEETIHKVELAVVHREGTSDDECSDSRSAAEAITKREKDVIVLADTEGLESEKFVVEVTEERDSCRLSTVLKNEHMRHDLMGNPISARKDLVEFFPGEVTSLMKSSSIPRGCAWNMENAMEILKMHLYLATVTKDFLQLQITEQIDKQPDVELSDEVSRLQGLVWETQERSSGIQEELDQCKTELQIMFSSKRDLEIQCLSAKGEIEGLSARVLELQSEMELSQKEAKRLSAELAECTSVAGTLEIENSKLTLEILSGTEEIQKLKAEKEQSTVQTEELNARMCELQNELELSKKESMDLSVELADCKGLMMALQTENSNLTVQILSSTEDINKLKTEKDALVNENTVLVSALSEQKDLLAVALDKVAELEGDLKETMVSVGKLTEENISLLNYLDIHKSQVKEHENGFQELLAQAQGFVNHVKNSTIGSMISNNTKGDPHISCGTCLGEVVVGKVNDLVDPCLGQSPSEQAEWNDSNEPAALYVLKGHLLEAEEMLQNLEKAIRGMHDHHMSLGKSGSKVASSGVSKLIQAFESKVHSDDVVSDEVPLVEREKSADSYSYNITKEQICNLRAILKQMALDVEMTKVLFKKEQDNMHIARKFEVECEALTLKNNELQRTIDEFGMKLTEYKPSMDNLQSQLDSTWQNADEMAGRLLDQVEYLQKEVNGMSNALEKEMNTMKDVISGSSQKLDAYTGLLVVGNLDIDSHLTASVNAVTEMIEDLQEKLEAACLDRDRSHNSYDELYTNYSRLCESQESTNRILCGIQSSFAKLLRECSVHLEKPALDTCENLVDVKAEGLQQLPPGDFEILIEQLIKILNERSLLHSVKDELESELALRNQDVEVLKEKCAILAKSLEENSSTIDELRSLLMRRDQDFDELNKGCLALTQEVGNWEIDKSQFVVLELVGNVEVIVKSDRMEIESIKQLLMHLGTLVTLLLQMRREATEQLNLSKNCLQEALFHSECLGHHHSEPLHLFIKQDIMPRITELLDFEEKVNWLSSKNVQQENEMQVLKQSLDKVEEAFEKAHSELNSKIAELKQSEQRLSSVREKLSIAVSKGKGLVVQRDGLKQSLMEKSSELEMCLQELHSKEARLFDLEAKLKSSEADRIEALESELSYIRNSATAFRDSFLQKDSMLQKIEEVMEELDLPEDFHSKDIVEKVEWLAKSVAESTSLQSTDWEQKSSLGGSQAEPGLVVMHEWKDGLQSVSSPRFDDLKRKYEELLSRFYGLAEQNDMLEQSLVERNDLVQRWEKILDRIDMPLQLKSLEPEDRLEWLGRKFLEVQQDRDFLLTKIDSVEISTESLLSDLEASQGKISDLDAALVAIRHENEFLSENLAKLRSELLEVSGRAAHSELEKDSLQRELAGLQEKLAEKSECKACIETATEMKKLHDLLGEALPDHLGPESPGTSSSDVSVKYLESSLRMLLDNYKKNSSENYMISNDSSGVRENMMLEEQNLKELLDDKEQSLMALKLELDEVSHNLVVAKEERDIVIERCNVHISEMEALMQQRDTLQRERETAVDKHQSLVSEFEAMIKQRDTLQQERETAIVKYQSLVSEFEAMTEQRDTLQKEKETAIDKYQSLVSEFESMVKQRDLLQDQLNQEEQRTASIREKLNVAVRKGKVLVQQRDSLKQTIEEMNNELNRVKEELNQHLETLQSENNSLKCGLAESENTLREHSQTLNSLLTALYSIDLGAETNIVDPIQKLEWIRNLCHDLRAALVSSENEAIKSKKAAKLLVAELNEVHERADSLQEDLGKAEAALARYSRERDIAEAERRNAVSHLEQFMIANSAEKKKRLGSIIELKDGIFELRKGSLGLSKMLDKVLSRDVDLFCSMKLSVESIMKLVDGSNSVNLPLLAPSDHLSNDVFGEDASFSVGHLSEVDTSEDVDDGVLIEYIQVAGHSLYECLRELADLKEKLHEHSFAVDQQFKDLSQMVVATQSRISSRELFSESLKRDIAHFEIMMKNKENELSSIHRNISLLYEACRKSILELKNRRAQVVGKSGMPLILPSWVHGEGPLDGQTAFSEDFMKTVADSLLATVKGSSVILEEVVEETQKELKATILDFQRELQEKDVQQNRICAELVSQIREAEAVARTFSVDLDSAKVQVEELESQIKEMENHQKLSETRINELKNLEASAKEYEQRIKSLMDSLTAKDQEIEGLMQALDEEESEMESLQSRNQELEQIVRQNNLAAENLEASRAKALTKLSTTLSRFDELHHLSENLLAEIENLQSQIQERDSDISFLRQEVARCTNDVLAKQESNKKILSDLSEVQTWMDTMVLRLGGHKLNIDNPDSNRIHSYIRYLDKQIPSIIAELEDLRIAAQDKDALLDIEKGRVNELSHRAEVLEISLREKESQIQSSGGAREPGQLLTVNSPDALEVEPMINKRSALGSIVPHARSGRRVNNDQIAIAIDSEQDNSTLDDEDDDKAHGFKSLTTSKIVPRVTRPVADRVDGLWVAIERLLMRQPTLRLGLIVYWVALHALLAASI